MSSLYREEDTEGFYDREDSHYRAFWDKAGSLHWGIFDDGTGNDFLKACANLTRIMAQKSGLSEGAHVIDLGCGNGNTAMWLAESFGCRVVGIDLSGVRVQAANETRDAAGAQWKQRVSFRKVSIATLPLKDGTFTHAWSQAAIYHVPDKESTLREACRVLKNDGLFVFDDLIKPRPDTSAMARQYVYDRLLFDTDYSFESYQEALANAGFRVLEATDLSEHLARSYARLAELARQAIRQDSEHFEALSFAYQKMVACIENRDVGWAMYVCQKSPVDGAT